MVVQNCLSRSIKARLPMVADLEPQTVETVVDAKL